MGALQDNTKVEALKVIAKVYSMAEKDKLFGEYEVKAVVKKMIEDVRTVIGSPINLFNTYMVEDSRHLHAVHVCVITIAMGLTKGLPIDMLEDVAIGALLHDVKLPVMEADKSQFHTQDGFEYLKQHRSLSTRSYMIAYAHHEHYDGSGFPRGASKGDIYEGARLVTVADMYDNLVSGYGKHEVMAPHEAFEFMNMQAGKVLDEGMVEYFKNCIALYPTGVSVHLSSGKKGLVVRQNMKMPFRPVVRICEEGDCTEYDLLEELTLFIDKVYME
jgi:HD-GYP domain-containing protein (c-di-GMP phosphodiesterase class II)